MKRRPRWFVWYNPILDRIEWGPRTTEAAFWTSTRPRLGEPLSAAGGWAEARRLTPSGIDLERTTISVTRQEQSARERGRP